MRQGAALSGLSPVVYRGSERNVLFGTPHPGYLLTGIVQEEPVYHPQTGKYLNTKPGIDASFGMTLPRWAMDIALDDPKFHAAWSGLPPDQPRTAYVGAYDTDVAAEMGGWDEATKDHVEQFLLNNVDFGQRYFLFEPPSVRLEEPWRGYDSTHHHKIKVIARELDPESQRYALEYEQATKNRPAVVEALTEIVGDDVVVAA